MASKLKTQWIKCPDCRKWFKTMKQYQEHLDKVRKEVKR